MSISAPLNETFQHTTMDMFYLNQVISGGNGALCTTKLHRSWILWRPSTPKSRSYNDCPSVWAGSRTSSHNEAGRTSWWNSSPFSGHKTLQSFNQTVPLTNRAKSCGETKHSYFEDEAFVPKQILTEHFGYGPLELCTYDRLQNAVTGTCLYLAKSIIENQWAPESMSSVSSMQSIRKSILPLLIQLSVIYAHPKAAILFIH